MFRMKKILFPVDFSARSEGAAHFVEDMAGRFQSSIVFLHVVGRREDVFFAPEFAGSSMMEQFEHHRANAHLAMAKYLSEDFKHFHVQRLVLEGDPAETIVRCAAENSVDLIMMPSHGYGVFRRYILGSVTAKVLHDASCPVWTAAHMEEAPPLEAIHFNKIVCSVDLGPQTDRALLWANAFATEHGAELIAFHSVAWEPLTLEARLRLEQTLHRLHIKARAEVRDGEAAKEAAELAAEEAADLMIIARGSAADGRGRLRTNAYALIRESPCPIVSV
jgi:nucleotide-binding universal stress UspA family protein